MAAWAAGQPLPEALNAACESAEATGAAEAPPVPVRFVPQSALPAGEGYEAFIRRTACVPTRENLHDFFNGLVWLHQPALKARLNAWHALEPGAQRGPLRDALTLLDENGALLLDAPAALQQALRERDWERLFLDLRPLWRQARLLLLGHALMEKLLQPRKPLCAHLLLAEPLAPEALRHKPFQPLPVLGVPGWWPANEDAGFYADRHVFRPLRSVQTG